jgi:RNA 3'-phosphate cyclase
MQIIDGSHGEGGGQILRTSLSLAALRGQAVRIEKIRAQRSKPGLRPQHLTALKALAAVTQAEVSGDAIGSTSLTFKPHSISSGNYTFDVAQHTPSAGSVTLIAQALLPVLMRAGAPSTLILQGGTHVPWSPPAHYLSEVFLPALQEMGVSVGLELHSWGWYPSGGGEIRLRIQPRQNLSPVTWMKQPEVSQFQGLSAGANLPEHIINRQRQRLRSRWGDSIAIQELPVSGRGPGTLVFLWGPHAGFSALGKRGKRAEAVADEAAEAFTAFQDRQAAVDKHLADQILLYLALAGGRSEFSTEAITSHLLTNIWVIEQFLGKIFKVRGTLGERGEIQVTGEPAAKWEPGCTEN